MCDHHKDCCCGKKKDPKECTQKQIKECHGDVKDHPCEGKHKGPY